MKKKRKKKRKSWNKAENVVSMMCQKVDKL